MNNQLNKELDREYKKNQRLKYANMMINNYPEMLDVMEVLIIGANKPGRYMDQWLTPEGQSMGHEANSNSRFHHLAKVYAGEVIDADSGLPHDLLEGCRALMSHVLRERGIKNTTEDK